jgi:hypothetical protein
VWAGCWQSPSTNISLQSRLQKISEVDFITHHQLPLFLTDSAGDSFEVVLAEKIKALEQETALVQNSNL